MRYIFDKGGQNSIYDPTVVFGNNYMDIPQQEEAPDNAYTDYLQQRVKDNNSQEAFDFSSLIPEIPQEDIEKNQLYEKLFSLEQRLNNKEDTFIPPIENSDNVPYDWTKSNSHSLEKYGSAYTGLDPKVTQATEEMLNKFPNLRLTSGKRNWGDKDAHPIGRAVDLSYDQDAYDYYKNTIVPKYGFNRALDPHHGTGTHIHLGYYRNGGQHVPSSDVMQNRVPIGMQQIPIDPFTGQPLTREQISRFMPSFNTQQPVISQGTWKGNRTTKDNSYDPYLRIIEQDPESEANIGKRMRKDLITKKVPAGLAAAATIMAAPVVAPIVGAAMEAPLAGVAGLTGSNIINAGFATHGLQSVLSGDVVKPWQQAYKSGNPWDYANAAAENVMTGMELFPLVGPGYKGALEAGKYLTEETALKNAYNLNPGALKENPETFLYRAEPSNFNSQSTIDFMKQEVAAGREKSWYKGTIKSYEEGHPKLMAQNDFHGQWLEKDPARLDFYLNSGDKVDVGTPMSILRTKIPTSETGKYSVANNAKANVISASPNTEFVMPRNIIEQGEKFPASSWQQLIQEDKAFNTPHWLKGYGKKSNLKVFTEGQPYENDINKNFGISIDDLKTSNILKKTKNIEKNVDLGIGKFDHTNLVEYDNGLQLHTYSKPGSLVDDVMLMYNPKNGENIAYIRNYTIGKNWENIPTNEWHIKADMPKSDKELVKFANKELEKVVPIKPIKYENKTISTDGLRYWNQQYNYGFKPLEETTNPYVSLAGKDDLFKGLKYYNNNDAFDVIKFINKEDATEGAKRLQEFIKKQGNDYKVIINDNNTLQINLPKLQREFNLGGSVKIKTPKENLYYKQGGAIITNRGQWDYPGQTTIIPSNQITMQGVPYPVMGVDNTGHTKMMHPGMNYTFPGQYVTEYPIAQNGLKVQPGQLPTRYVTDPNDKRLRSYQDSLNLYNKSKEIDKYWQTQYIDQPSNGINPINNGSANSGIYPENYSIKPAFYHNYRRPKIESGMPTSVPMYKQPVQPVELQNKQPQTKVSIENTDVDKEYNKKHPPIYVTNPKDPSIGMYTEEGNQILYKEKKKTSPSMQSLQPQKYNPMPEWEQRLYNGSKLRLNNDDGSYSSHKMMNWESDGKFYAAPTIINNNGKLQELSPEDAIAYHREHNSAKEFNSDAEAMQYADNGYKALANVEKPESYYLPINPLILPQQHGKPVYGPGHTIIGYRGEDGKVKKAYQYTGAPNNELNLQDKALLEDKDKWQQYLSSRDSGYKFEDGEQKMQVGGFSLNPFVLPLLSPVTSLVSNLFSKSNTQAPTIANASNASNVTNSFLPTSSYNKMADSYLNKRDAFYKKMNSNDYKEYKTSPNSINLSSGRFKGASVSPEMIDDIVKASKANNVDPWLMLSLVGRESTFGSGQESNKFRADNKRSLVSGWNVAEDYTPYGLDRYLADQKVPGIRTEKDNHGYQYYIDNQDSVDNYLKQNPQLIEKYNKKLESTPDIGNMDSFNLAAKRIKKKGIQNYNPGDPKYYDMVIQDMDLLKKDNALKTYMISKGYKQGGNVEMDSEYFDLQNPYDLELMKAGGIPDRYKNMGFTHVGQKKQGDGKHKWKVLAKKGDQYKVVQGGWRGMQDFKQHHSEQRKENFWNRMGGRNSSKATDPFSPLYWHKRLGTWQEGGQNSIYDPTVVFGNNYADTPQQEEVPDNTYNDYLQQRLKNNNLQEDFDFSSLIPDVPQEDIEKKQLYERLFNLEQKINNSEDDLVSITENSDNIPYDWTSNTGRKLNSSSFNYDDYRNKIDNYLKEKHPNAPVSGENFAKAAQESFFKTGKIIPVELVIAQAELESNFGTSGGRPTITKNIYNVGNTDDGSNNIQKDWQSGINKYYDLLSTKYLVNKKPDDLLHNFVNTSGNRYASDKNYERKLKYLINNLD